MVYRQFIRYFISGSTALVVHLGVLALLVELFATNETMASGAGFVVAVMVNYTIQHTWVFEAEGRHKEHLPRYVVVTLLTFALNLGLFWVAVNVAQVWYPVAQVFTTGVVFILNFVINRQFTFKVSI
jgi:putative flippase GtrA